MRFYNNPTSENYDSRVPYMPPNLRDTISEEKFIGLLKPFGDYFKNNGGEEE